MCILSSSEKRRKERSGKKTKYSPQKKKRPWLQESDRSERNKHNVECIEIDEYEEGEC